MLFLCVRGGSERKVKNHNLQSIHCICLLTLHCFLLPDESDYQTDYDEEAVESALSDMEMYSRSGEHTEGEETADTV